MSNNNRLRTVSLIMRDGSEIRLARLPAAEAARYARRMSSRLRPFLADIVLIHIV